MNVDGGLVEGGGAVVIAECADRDESSLDVWYNVGGSSGRLNIVVCVACIVSPLGTCMMTPLLVGVACKVACGGRKCPVAPVSATKLVLGLLREGVVNNVLSILYRLLVVSCQRPSCQSFCSACSLFLSEPPWVSFLVAMVMWPGACLEQVALVWSLLIHHPCVQQ